MAIEEQKHVALPKLVGQPAYARPTRPVSEAPRPFDPDDLPLTVALSDEERDWVESLPARAYAPGGGIKIGDEAASRTSAGAHPPLGSPLPPQGARRQASRRAALTRPPAGLTGGPSASAVSCSRAVGE